MKEKDSPDPKLFLIYHSVIQSKHSGEIFVNFLCFVFEILAVEVCTFSTKSELEANRSDVIDAH